MVRILQNQRGLKYRDMIPIFLITLGLILTLSGIHQATKPNIHWMDYEMQRFYIVAGIIFFIVGVIKLLV
jgi:hypothetical protein